MDDDFAEKIKDFGPSDMYDATKLLLTHAYTEEEILNHTVSGKWANSKVTTDITPKFTTEVCKNNLTKSKI